MKRWLLLFLLASASAFAQYGYIPFIQVNSNSGATCVFPKNVVSGNIAVVIVTDEGTITGISDTLGSTWTLAASNTSFTARAHIWTTTFGSSGADTVTIAGGSAVNPMCIEMSPLVMTTTLDASAINNWTSSASTFTAPNVTTTQNSDIVFTFFGSNNSGKYYTLQSPNTGNDFPAGMNTSFDGIAAFISVAGAAGTFTGLTVNNPTSAATGTKGTIAFKAPSTLTVQSPTIMPDGTISSAYNYKLLATSGTGSYVWSLTSGTLPTGLSLNSSTGVVSGTLGALTSNNYSLTFQVSDGTHTASKAMTLKIGASSATPSLIQSVGTTSSNALSFSSNVTAGHLIAVHAFYRAGGGAVSVCTDTLGTTFRIVSEAFMAAGQGGIGFATIELGFASSTGADTITCLPYPGGTTGGIKQIAEFSNVSAFDISQVVVNSGATGTTASSGTLTTLMPNELLLMNCSNYTNSVADTVNSPFTPTETTVTLNNKLAYQIASTVTSYSGTCTIGGSDAWGVGLVGVRSTSGAVVIASTGQPWVIVVN